MIKVSNQGVISELGKRANNEDSCGFIEGQTYVVCDGVGGAEKGEVASDIVVRCFIESFKNNIYSDANVVLREAESKLTEYINIHPEAEGMATTLTLSQVRENGIYVAWCGDSRIYQFRDREIIFQTTDHSWVNDALRSGIITTEEAVNHPKSNIITRAVQGSYKPTNVDTVFLTNVQKGDLFLHCSDGVLESWSNDDLIALFSTESNSDKILEIIKQECGKQSKDNFTAILYQIGEAVIPKDVIDSSGAKSQVELPNSSKEPLYPKNHFKKIKSKILGILKVKISGIPLLVILVAFLPFIIFLIVTNGKEHTQSKPDKSITSDSIQIQHLREDTSIKQYREIIKKNDTTVKTENLAGTKLDENKRKKEK